MKTLPIVWQRLVQGGQTCDRCAATHNELDSAMAMLRAALKPLGIEPVMEVKEITMIAFTGDPLASNRIWIAGRPMEDWIGATVGRSQCCSVCGDSDCRTVKIGDAEYETVPKEVFIRAALIAAAALLGEPATA